MSDRPGLTPVRAVVALLLGLLAAGVLIGALGEAELTPGPTDTAPVGADSTRVLELQGQFAGGQDQTAVVLYATDGSQLSPADVSDLERGFAEATGNRAPLQVSEDRTAAIGVTVGLGGIGLAVIATVLTLLILRVTLWFETRTTKKRSERLAGFPREQSRGAPRPHAGSRCWATAI